jgi:S-adenosylmethionine synthetase
VLGVELDYFTKKVAILTAMQEYTEQNGDFRQIRLHYSCLDQPGWGLSGVCLSLIGTFAEEAQAGFAGGYLPRGEADLSAQ